MAAWGTSTWNTGSFGTGADNTVIPTGTAASVALGQLDTSSTVEAGWGRDAYGARPWGSPNQIVTPVLPEDDMTMSLGSVVSTAEVNVGWGRLGWNKQAWGIAGSLIAPGDAVTANLGSVTTTADANTGPSSNNNQLLTTGLGSVTAFGLAQVDVTGFGLTNNLGTVDASPDAMPTGLPATMGLGTVEAFNLAGWGRLGWSINDWGDAGSSVQVDVSGIAMTAALGTPTEITGDATIVANTLNVAQLTLGQVDPAPDAMIIGQAMIASLGTLGFKGDVLPVPTGLPLTAGLGSVTVDLNQQVNVTGNPLLARVASASGFTDVTATFNGFGLTTTLGNGNALIWNEVNTGSAPIDPPGWREVVA
jgi:hypothetical protein